MKVEYSPRILKRGDLALTPCPVADDAYACKLCGALVTEQDLERHMKWHNRPNAVQPKKEK